MRVGEARAGWTTPSLELGPLVSRLVTPPRGARRGPRHPRPPLPPCRPAAQLVAPVAVRPQPARLGRAHERRVGERRGTWAWAWAWAWVRMVYARALSSSPGTCGLELRRALASQPNSNPCLAPRRPCCARALTRASGSHAPRAPSPNPSHAPPCFEPLSTTSPRTPCATSSSTSHTSAACLGLGLGSGPG